MQAERLGGDGEGGDEAAGTGPRFGALLRRHRLAARLTQEALAERAALGVRTVQGLEEGAHRPRRETARRRPRSTPRCSPRPTPCRAQSDGLPPRRNPLARPLGPSRRPPPRPTHRCR